MAESRYFSSLTEIWLRESFDSECIVTLQNFVTLVAEYNLDEDGQCQLERKGFRCGRDHRHGWLARIDNGKEALIGGDCAEAYFGAESVFTQEANRIALANSIAFNVERISRLLDDPEYRAELSAAQSRLAEVKGERQKMCGSLPKSVYQRLEAMGKSGNTALNVELKSVEIYEENGEKKQRVRWSPQRLATIAGIDPWSYDKVEQVSKRLRAVEKTLKDAKPEESAGERTLRLWAKSLDELQPCARAIEDLHRSWQRFKEPVNLRWVCLLGGDGADAKDAAAHLFSLKGVKDRRAQHFVDELKREIRTMLNSEYRML